MVNLRRLPPPLSAHVALLIVSLLFGANYVVAKLALREISPLGLVVVRAWGTSAVLFPASFVHHRASARTPLHWPDIRRLFLHSLLGISINQMCFLAGLARSTATNASIMLVTTPLLTLSLAVMLGRERGSTAAVVGIVLGLAGALLLIVPRGGLDFSSRAAEGNFLLLMSSASYSSYLVLTRSILARHDPLRVVSWVFLLAALTVSPIGLGAVRDAITAGPSAVGLASVAFVVVGGTAVPYLLNNWALMRVPSSMVAVYVLLQPIVAATLGVVFLHEHLGAHTLAAAALVLTGVIVAVRR